jgi:hypothetical protein
MDRHRTCDPLFHASEAVHRPGRQELRRIAVVFGEDSLTYGELDARANSSGTCCKGGNLDDSDRLRLPELAADLVRHQVSDRSALCPAIFDRHIPALAGTRARGWRPGCVIRLRGIRSLAVVGDLVLAAPAPVWMIPYQSQDRDFGARRPTCDQGPHSRAGVMIPPCCWPPKRA